MSKTATYALIASANGTGSSGTVTFSSIPATYTDLRIVFNGGVNTGNINFLMQHNSDTNANYSSRNLTADGTSVVTLSPLSNVTNIICNYYTICIYILS
jgi:hypothetical protein